MKRILTKDELRGLSEQIAEVEKKTAAEIRVVVRHKKHWSERKLSARQLAEKEFRMLGMTKTRRETGILVFILVSERRFEILADRGIVAALPQEHWEKTAEKLSEHFSKSNFSHGLKTILSELGEVLENRLPHSSTDQNELPNDIIEE